MSAPPNPSEADLLRRFEANHRAAARVDARARRRGRLTPRDARSLARLTREGLAIMALVEDLGYHRFDAAAVAGWRRLLLDLEARP